MVEGLNAIPLTDVEKLDCNRTLTPQVIKKIEIGKLSKFDDLSWVNKKQLKTNNFNNF
jgi:hypothetical protein